MPGFDSRPGLLWRCLSVFLLVGVLLPASSATLSAQSLAGNKGLNIPDPFRTVHGRRITTVREWYSIRRPELLRWFTTEVYGRAPGKPARLRFRVFDNDPHALNGRATRKQVDIFFKGSDSPQITILLYIPNNIKGPAPVFIGLNFSGNQTIVADTAIRLPLAAMAAKVAARGSAADRWPLEMILARGYAVATVHAGDIAPDRKNGFQSGVQARYPGLEKGGDNFATLSAWAWGLERAMDYLETDPQVDARAVAVFGWSRMGKAALWAGAQDTRFAAVISNESGAGGAKLFHHFSGENTHRLCTVFPYWFCRNFQQFDGKDTVLPFDQNELAALIAPRPLYIASAAEDTNSDPVGEFMTALAVDTVYRFLGVQGLPVTSMPSVNHPVLGNISYHIRSGGHYITPYDWTQYLHFADRYLKRQGDQ